jgi:flagellar biosynthesis protein FlhF
MEIKTFEAFSMKDAVKALKKDFGSDAVIISTKEKPSVNGNGKIFEVTAASYKSSVDNKSTQNQDISSQLEPLLTKLNVLFDSLPSKKTIENVALGVNELKIYVMEALKAKDGALFENLPTELIGLQKHLSSIGISESNVFEAIKYLRNLPSPTLAEIESSEFYSVQVKNELCKWIYKNIRIASKWEADAAHTTFKVIIGPYGSGKSTLIGKLASYYLKREKQNVAVISIDQSRIAAADQMRIFCKIAGVPFYTASTRDELGKITKNLGSTIVFIDTQGIGSKDKGNIDYIKSMFSESEDIEYHLCLSLTEKETYNEQVIQTALPLSISSISFTKIDESMTYGELFNLAKKWSIPLSYFSYGAQISEEFERASKERVIERLFGKI